VRDQMGHQSIQVTADVYGRFIPAAIAQRSTRSTTRSNHLQPPRNQRLFQMIW
jgi:hypothetical protein